MIQPPSRTSIGRRSARARRTLRRGCIVERSLSRRSRHDYLAYLPWRIDPGAPLLVSVHGISLNAREHLELFAPLAEQRGLVMVAPVFSPRRFRSFQRLSAGGRRPDLFLDRVVDDVSQRAGCNGARFAMFGFSGGGQFGHRYALGHPQRVRSLILAAPGWYTFPDPEIAYPRGIGASAAYPHVRCRLDEFLRIPTRVVVGEKDTERDESLNTDPEIDRLQGSDRRERAARWVDALRRAARERGLLSSVSLSILPGVSHSFSECVAVGDLARIVFESIY